ncbi:hypothetical protein Y032_0079g1232 [Ancylostoma ceylanicum]|uniref:non-specific protein-tyrosine kinase n=1 Tax=Ancylostoma ceylanicum TaxID=53326 RepID=A0A016TTZ1_9BILA|nr:hypothetical protein Y032_0079g1232 [Ancylostoma ceylanicum]
MMSRRVCLLVVTQWIVAFFQTYDLLTRVGDFLGEPLLQEHFIITVRKREQSDQEEEPRNKNDEEMEEAKKQRDENELRHIPIKYSRRAKLYYVRLYGFKWVSGLIEYHRRNKIAFDEDGTIIKRAIKRADWQLNHEQIVKTKKLGDGAFGDVYKGILRTGLMESREVAIKTIIGSISSEENEKLFREAMLMRRLVHPNVVMLIGVASNEEPVMIVMEFAQGGSVLDAVQAKPGPSVYVRIKYCHGAALGLQYLSGQGMFQCIIDRRIRDIIKIPTNQCDFVANSGTANAIYVLLLSIENHREKERQHHPVFVDMDKAFDSFSHQVNWCALCWHGVPEELIEWVRIVKRDLKKLTLWILLYEDGVMLVSEHKVDLKSQTKACCERLAWFDLQLKIEKTEQMTTSLRELALIQIIHRDVAARNCLIGKHDTAKISDFGLSIVGTQKKEKTLRKVPVRYLAPETLKKREYTVKTDVWSFGVFMWEVFHDGKEPYAEMNAKEVRKYVLGGNTLDNESDHYPQHMWSITMSCFARDPQSRPAFDSIAAQIWSGIEEFKEHNSMLSFLRFW